MGHYFPIIEFVFWIGFKLKTSQFISFRWGDEGSDVVPVFMESVWTTTALFTNTGINIIKMFLFYII